MASLLLRRLRSSPLTIVIFLVVAVFLYNGWSPRRRGSNGERYAPIYVDKLPQPQSSPLPRLQADFPPEAAEDRAERLQRQEFVKERFMHSWASYKKLAFGADELRPLSGQPMTAFGGWGATLVDSLDALWILGLKDEFEEAVARTQLIDFSHTEVEEINVFETTIRYLGGFLGAYDVSGGNYPLLLEKAVEIGELVYEAFDTPNRMPVTRWKTHAATAQRASPWALIAELGSLNVELTRLSQLTNNTKYYDAAYRVARAMDDAQMQTQIPGLWPVIVDADKLSFDYNAFTLGGMADSAFEYLPKMHALIGGGDDLYRRDYERAIRAIRANLLYKPLTPDNADILVAGSAQLRRGGEVLLEAQGQHLTCFVGGMVLLAAKLFNSPDEFDIGRKLVDGCIWAYDSMPTGIMPEVFHLAACPRATKCQWSDAAWHAAVLAAHPDPTSDGGDDHDPGANAAAAQDSQRRARDLIAKHQLRPGYTALDDTRYGLRPEAIESVFVLYRLTGEARYADAAWRMFQAIDRATRTELAHANIENVAVDGPPRQTDKMESFWFAETLKYFYLVFSDPELLSLDRYVLNTEAHPFLRPGAEWKEGIVH